MLPEYRKERPHSSPSSCERLASHSPSIGAPDVVVPSDGPLGRTGAQQTPSRPRHSTGGAILLDSNMEEKPSTSHDGVNKGSGSSEIDVFYGLVPGPRSH
jgi:hypothetical protein